MEFEELVRERRSVRKFTASVVEADKIEKMLECARLAPSWKNLQCWQFVVVRDRGKIVEMAKTAGVVNRWYKDAPVMIVGCADPTLSGEREGLPYFLVDFAIAMEHLILAATDQGLGACWVGIFDEKQVRETLKIPESLRVVALAPIGYPAERESLQGKITKFVVGSKNRKPLKEIVYYEEFGKRAPS